ncbi:cortical protein marker for cell polarity-domain-containing protein [Vararia minispora EC-137]|uniref:Cortical protein marker for cell polarity-domain-containing protein n=1 Tax=Vararia minispora EC-137 TaxID=1314806 RepID=A0ACB8QWG1_9AGAM|nr:cortical protein marker for cell polarity-domain-containing protein [Vararia minispora EC-137]
MGSVALAGAFAGMGLFDNTSALTFDPSQTTVFARADDGSLSPLGATNQGGSVLASCTLGNTVYLAGSFSSINGTSASNVVSYDPAKSAFAALPSNGPNGPVHALFCDSSRNQVWAGGAFSSPGSAVAVYDTKANSWSAAPFGGLSGAAAEVLSITTNTSASSLFFAGSFLTSFGGNGTVLNNTNNPNVPFSAGATPFSSSLVPIPLQNASIQGAPSSSQSGFSNIQNILCPSGSDGAGSTWFAADGNTAVITARAFEFISASGVRLGNTFLSRSTTTFSVASIPDNAVRTLHYVDPATKQNLTCSDACPLSTDSSVLYQDFTFDSELSLTGVQVTLSGWTGAGPGLHILQLLSSGAFASAVPSQNAVSCFAPAASNTSHTGAWTELVVNTNIAATQQSVLVANVPVGQAPSQSPTVTWQPYVSASGQYEVRLLVPGCTELQDCAARTSVKVTVFPGAGQNPTITTVDQTNTADASPVIFTGPVVPSSPNFVTTITMTIADNPTGSGSGGNYQLVADRVQLVLQAASTNGSSTTGANSTTTSGRTSFGFFEWPLSSSSSVNAQTSLPNSTETAADAIGIGLASALGSNAAGTQDAVTAVVHHASGTIVFGGSFSLSSPSSANIAVLKNNGQLAAVSAGGLNGNVTAFALSGDKLFVGGAFTDTVVGSGSGAGALSHVAVYDVVQDSWSALQAGVDGPVSSLLLVGNKLVLAGNFSTLLDVAGSSAGQRSPGLAVWDIAAGAWDNAGGLVVGAMEFVGNSSASAGAGGQIVAGKASASMRFGASGLVMVSNGQDGAPVVTPMGVLLDDGDGVVGANTTATATRRRRAIPKRVGPSAWVSSFRPRLTLFSRQSAPLALPALPSPAPATAPAVFAATFWTNTTSGDEVIVLGGNFTFASGRAAGVALYDPSSATLRALAGEQPNGTVHALLVSGEQLFVGGEFTLAGVSVNGFAVYDLGTQSWETGIQPLVPAAGSSVLVRSLTTSSARGGTVVVAGRFASAGGLACNGICFVDAGNKQWNAVGQGVLGEVAGVDYVGDNQEVLVVAGSLALSGASSATNVLQYAFANNSWAAVGDAQNVPGLVTAITVNDRNASSIFAAGRTSDGTSSFLSFFNGAIWSTVGSTLGSSNISQLAMVPLQDTHAANGIVQQDRMLMVSGALEDSSFGSAAAALFDGASLLPYVMAADATGAASSVSGLFHSLASFSFAQRHLLATGIVILISIAIAAGVVFLLVLIGVLWTLLARRDDALGKLADDASDDDASAQHRPSSLLAHINAATRTTILGAEGGALHPPSSDEAAATHTDEGKDPFAGPDASNWLRAETPAEAMAGMMAGEDEEPGRQAHARYSFDGAGDGELPLSVGQELEVLDDHDHSWWYARDIRTGREGVVPAAYLY